ncbi:MAG: metallophosphoesterase [Spirochaetes bacterium]|nr:metallophosphoesterase [Spirochaetota bacterium]
MRSSFALFFSVVFTIYTLIQVFIGIHGWKILKVFQVPLSPVVYWVTFGLVAYSYILSRVGNHTLPEPLYRGLHSLGAYWLGAMLYFFLFFLIWDGIYLIFYLLSRVYPSQSLFEFLRSSSVRRILGGMAILSVGSLLVWGALVARSPRITHYTLTIPKQSSRNSLRVVFVSDLHLGTLIGKPRLEQLVQQIESFQADVVLLGGDVLDEDLGPFVQQNMTETLAKLRPPLGVYAIPGNHEYIGRHLKEFSQYLQTAGVKILIDEKVQIHNSITLIGRDDRASERFDGHKRKPLSQLMEGVDRNHPILLMDHQPFGLEEAEQEGIDLQLSGHTHRGQLWPNQLITRKVYELDYGYKRKGNTHVIVSSGYGTWGPPLRIGSPPEIVVVDISFTNTKSSP